MRVEKILVTATGEQLRRYRYLFEALSHSVTITTVRSGTLRGWSKYTTAALSFSPDSMMWSERFHKNARAFVAKSVQTEKTIKRLGDAPDLVLHIHGMYAPFWRKIAAPYAMYLDYTMALAQRMWPPWAPFPTAQACEAWMRCERLSYERAHRLFTLSRLAKSSLVEDYDIDPDRISVVRSAGEFRDPYEGEKSFGTRQILFISSNFTRKGGDLLVSAFRAVKRLLPDARLLIVGEKLDLPDDGVVCYGCIAAPQIRDLFLKCDLMVLPSRCDPHPLAVIEAMNYGVPCIVSGADGMPEIVDNEINGIVIDRPDVETLAQHITILLNDPARLTRMSQAARQKIRRELNWTTVANRIMQSLGQA